MKASRVRDLVPTLDNRFRYAVEARHRSWFQDLAYSFFAENDICLAWSQLTELQTPVIVTTDFVYLGLIGDRRLQEKDFGKIQIDRVGEMQNWAGAIKKVEKEEKGINLAMIAANNHYAGFGPGTVNAFRGMLGLSEAKWEDKEEHRQESRLGTGPLSTKQSTLSDFLN
jgi:uncharacterized protein YecE (DUF72 family)